MLCFQATNIEFHKFALCGTTPYIQANNNLDPVLYFAHLTVIHDVCTLQFDSKLYLLFD